MLRGFSAILLLLVAVLMPCDAFAMPDNPVIPSTSTSTPTTPTSSLPSTPSASESPDTVLVESFTIDIDTVRLSPRFPGRLAVKPSSLQAGAEGDSLRLQGNTYAQRDWWYKLKHKQLQTDDPAVRWPSPFVGWCVGVYNWFQRNFNARDTTYVKSDGKMGKLMLTSDNWADNYLFGSKTLPYITMGSKMFPNFGIYAKYGILSIGYSVDISTLFGGHHSNHQKWNFSVGCARFNIEAHLWRNSGTTYIHRFSDIKELKSLDLPYDGLTFSAANIHCYYIFNNRRFDFGAALSYSNNQRISQGSALVGLDISRIVAFFDFTRLPNEIIESQPYPLESYKFHYQSYSVLGGYSFNWVLNKHFVLNVTAIPGIGVAYSREDASMSDKFQLAGVFKGVAGLLYTTKRFFIGARCRYHANAVLSDDIDFMNGRFNFQAAVGFRF